MYLSTVFFFQKSIIATQQYMLQTYALQAYSMNIVQVHLLRFFAAYSVNLHFVFLRVMLVQYHSHLSDQNTMPHFQVFQASNLRSMKSLEHRMPSLQAVADQTLRTMMETHKDVHSDIAELIHYHQHTR